MDKEGKNRQEDKNRSRLNRLPHRTPNLVFVSPSRFVMKRFVPRLDSISL